MADGKNRKTTQKTNPYTTPKQKAIEYTNTVNRKHQKQKNKKHTNRKTQQQITKTKPTMLGCEGEIKPGRFMIAPWIGKV